MTDHGDRAGRGIRAEWFTERGDPSRPDLQTRFKPMSLAASADPNLGAASRRSAVEKRVRGFSRGIDAWERAQTQIRQGALQHERERKNGFP